MTSTLTNNTSFATRWQAEIEYPRAGILSKILVKDKVCQYTLFCLAANTEISEHTSTRNATIHVLEGQGILTLSGEDIALESGVFVFMTAHAPHALKATENLAFLLTLSDKSENIE
jgi:quercetin dioxygenase-like cupin family protein